MSKSPKTIKNQTPLKVTNTDLEFQIKSFIYSYNWKKDILVAQIRTLDENQKLVTKYDDSIAKIRHPKPELLEGLNNARNFFFFSDKYKDEVKLNWLELREQEKRVDYQEWATLNSKQISAFKLKIANKEN